MNRRGFIRGLVGLAALAAAPTLSAKLIQTEQKRFLAEAATGVIRGKFFYLDGPVVLSGIHNLLIDECTFFFKKFGNQSALIINDCSDLTISNCLFESEIIDDCSAHVLIK